MDITFMGKIHLDSLREVSSIYRNALETKLKNVVKIEDLLKRDTIVNCARLNCMFHLNLDSNLIQLIQL